LATRYIQGVNKVQGANDGATVPTGYIGEQIPATFSATNIGGSDTVLASITLAAPGVYLVYGKIECSAPGSSLNTMDLSISYNSTAAHRPSQIRDRTTSISSNILFGTCVRYVVATSAGDVLRLIGASSYTGTAPATVTSGCQFIAVRIA